MMRRRGAFLVYRITIARLFFFTAQEGASFFLAPTMFRSRATTTITTLQKQRRLVAVTETATSFGDADLQDDARLLQLVQREQLVKLCLQCGVPTKGSKDVLLQRLRDHAAAQADEARKSLLHRKRRVEEGTEDSKERYEILNDGNGDIDAADDDWDEGFFFYEAPTIGTNSSTRFNDTATSRRGTKNATFLTSATVTAPPYMNVEPNEKGERFVTVYSTKEQNDLTGIAAAQPGQQNRLDDLTNVGDGGGSNEQQPWEMSEKTSSREIEQATEQVTELVSTLLAMSGAPAFVDLDEFDERQFTQRRNGIQFPGFNPANVPTETLASASKALRADRGRVLQDVLRQFELRAIGQDGMAGDAMERGGGHYREVNKVRAFLEGYRRAEVRRLARETTTLLLGKLVEDGVEGLDLALSTMVRSNDDTGEYAGELNDSLIDFLNDSIRQQQRKVEEMVAARRDAEKSAARTNVVLDEEREEEGEEDIINRLWNVTEEDGQRVETIDPNDPKVKQALEEELARTSRSTSRRRSKIPESAPEKLLLLLQLLRDRIKAEAAFAPDEKGRNLRMLAYCLQFPTSKEREQVILKEVGNSLDVSSFSFVCLVGNNAMLYLLPASNVLAA
jgi:hypothetical protein